MLQRNFFEQPGAFQVFIEHHPDGICLADSDGQLVHANESALTIFGYSYEEILRLTLGQLLDRSKTIGSDFNGNVQTRAELAVRHKNGHLVDVRMTCIPLVHNGQDIGRFLSFEDISQQQKQSKALSDIQEMFSFISEKSQNVISSFSADGVFTYISPSVKALLGYSPEDVIGKPATAFNHPEDNKKLVELRSSYFIDRDTLRFTGRVRHKNGGYRWYETTIEFIRGPSGEIIQSIGVGRDVTARKEDEETIAHLAYQDTLTDLPNRRLFKRRVSVLLEEARHEFHGLMLLDLDGFKAVNDSFGHDVGDQLLIEVANRLTNAIGDKGFAARWAGDEFTVFLTNIESKADMTSFIGRIKDAISEPVTIGDQTLDITASIGRSCFPEDGYSVDTLLRLADEEMYRAKNQTKD